jgi:dTDP-4-dehydrorhamnose reductase
VTTAMKILVTGAHGLLGQHLLRVDREGVELVGSGRSGEPVGSASYRSVQLDDPAAVARLMDEVQPQWVIHTAAITNVDRCQTERAEARRVNLGLVEILVSCCKAADIGLVQLSTDYVFSGDAGPYSEDAEPRPLSYYGQLKLESERQVLQSGIRGIVLRTLWLYGYLPGTRPNLVTWPLAALHRRETLRIVDDQWGNPTSVVDLADALVDLCRGDGAGLFHMGGSDFMTRHKMVEALGAFFGLATASVEPIETTEAGQSAPRPRRSGLNSDRLIATLGRRPLTLEQGLTRMSKDEHFRRDFDYLFT